MTKAAIHDARIHLYNNMPFLQVEVYVLSFGYTEKDKNLVANTLPSLNNIEMFLT